MEKQESVSWEEGLGLDLGEEYCIETCWGILFYYIIIIIIIILVLIVLREEEEVVWPDLWHPEGPFRRRRGQPRSRGLVQPPRPLSGKRRRPMEPGSGRCC